MPLGKTAGEGEGSYCLEKSQYCSYDLYEWRERLITAGSALYTPITVIRPGSMLCTRVKDRKRTSVGGSGSPSTKYRYWLK